MPWPTAAGQFKLRQGVCNTLFVFLFCCCFFLFALSIFWCCVNAAPNQKVFVFVIYICVSVNLSISMPEAATNVTRSILTPSEWNALRTRLLSILMLQRRYQHGGVEVREARKDFEKVNDRLGQRALVHLQARRTIAEGMLDKAAKVFEGLDGFADTFGNFEFYFFVFVWGWELLLSQFLLFLGIISTNDMICVL